MIEQEALLFSLLGFLTSLTISYFVSEGKAIRLTIMLSLLGALGGLLGAILWIILTGGVEITLYSLIIPIGISALFTFFILDSAHAKILGNKHIDNRILTIAVISLFLLSFTIAYLSSPPSFKSTVNTQQFTVYPLAYTPEPSIVSTPINTTPTRTIPIDINFIGASATPYTISEESGVGMYYKFKIYFTPKATWTMPYIKIAIYNDKDKNGKISTGDVLWSDADYKLSTGTSNWRVNCYWENINNKPQAKYCMFTYNGRLLPIFHANSITKSVDETTATFLNTPSGFTPQVDMITWDNTGIKEQIITYAAVNPGETTSIEGYAYCTEKNIGKNLIVIRAYCASSSDPFSEAPPLQEEIASFTVTHSPKDVTIYGVPLPGVALILTFFIIVFFFLAKKEGEI